jgi:cystathionine beta-lyase/cystathionine gamma-synthase
MLADLLSANPLTERVLYPGLKNHTSGYLATKLFSGKGYGAMITFSFSGDDNNMMRMRRDRFIEAVAGSIRLVPTLGDSHTILMPVEPVWGYKYAEPGMIRLSVGFEEPEYLKEVVSAALAEVS